MENNTNTNTETSQEGAVKTYTQEEVDKMIQSEADKRVTQALEKQKKKQAEAEKLSQMSAEEKVKYEYQQRFDELVKREQELTKKELTAEAIKILGEKSLPTDLVSMLVSSDAETTKANITEFEKTYNKMVAAGIKKALGQSATTPPAASNVSGGITKEQFQKMTLAQRTNLLKEQPEVFKSLSN